MKFVASAVVASVLLITGCGYQIGTKASLLPKDARTIAIVPWANASIHFTLSNYLAGSVSHEFIARTKYRIVSDPSKADLVLYGSVANMIVGGSPLYDNATGRTTAGGIVVWIQYRLVDHSGKVLINKPSMEFHQPYEVSVNPGQYFDESEASEKRLSVDVAKAVVSSIVENF